MKRLWKWGGALAGALLLVACGGGGGGGGSDFRVTLDRTSVGVTVEQNFSIEPLEIRARISGTPSGNVYVAATTTGAGISPNVGIYVNGTEGSVMLQPVTSLPVGLYSGTVTVKVCSDANCQNTIGGTPLTISYQVQIHPKFNITPQSLSFNAVESSAAPSQTLAITTPPASPLTHNVTYGAGASNWLSVDLSALTVTASAVNLQSGTYTAELTIQGSYPSTPIRIPVTFVVASAFMPLTQQIVPLTSDTTESGLERQISVGFNSGYETAWNASSNVPWLSVTTVNDGQVTLAIDTQFAKDLANFTDAAGELTISSNSANYRPQVIDVILRKRVAEISRVGPAVVARNTQREVMVRGRGFDSLTDVSNRLSIPQTDVISVERLNDTTLRVVLNPTDIGALPVTMSSALNISVRAGTLHVVEAPNFAETIVPYSGDKLFSFFDPRRNAIFSINRSTEALNRIQYDGSQWTVTSIPVPAIGSIGMDADANAVLMTTASSTASTLKLIDPDTLAVVKDIPVSGSFVDPFATYQAGLFTDNNGRTWLPGGEIWSGLSWFDSDSQRFIEPTYAPNLSTSYYSGPWMAMSRNGERVLVVQSASISPSPPMLQFNASEGLIRTNPIGETFSYEMSLSDDGNRVFFDHYIVRDQHSAQVGKVPSLGGNWIVLRGVLSPDGKRAYVLNAKLTSTSDYDVFHLEGNPLMMVYDTSIAAGTMEYLPEVGSFELSEYPGCLNLRECSWHPQILTDLTGSTLFFVGGNKLMIQPIPSNLRAGAATVEMAQPAKLWLKQN